MPDEQAGFKKGGRTRNQVANIHWIIEKARKLQKKKKKTHLFLLHKILCVDHNKLENS